MNVKETDKKFLARDSPTEDLQIVRSEGSFLFDAHGKKYIDFLMGWCVGNVGWGNKEIRAAINQFTTPDYVPPSYLYRPWAELAELLAEITPGKLKRSFRAAGGTEAVEIAIQAAMSHTRRHKFISIEGSYHGNSIGAMSIGSSDFREQYKNLLPHCHKVKPPLDRQAADKVEKLLKQRDIAAFIMEPIICNLGVLIPEKEFMQRVQQLCRKYGTLLIMDEVATGFGRTGKLFASEHFDLEPDIMCLAKAITGGYAPMGATITTEKVSKSMGEAGFYSTYGWHPLSVAAALANLKYIIKHQSKLLEHATTMSGYFRERLSHMLRSRPATLRIKGLAIGIDFAKGDDASELRRRCRQAGLLFTVEQTTVMMFPALNLDRKTAQEGMEIMEHCLSLV